MSYFKPAPFEYNLDRLTLEQKTARYDTISQLMQFHTYFSSLTIVSNPTNNYKKYSNEILQNISMYLRYGIMETQAPPQIKKLYQQFCQEYEWSVSVYQKNLAEQQQLVRQQQELQMIQYYQQQQMINIQHTQTNSYYVEVDQLSQEQGQTVQQGQYGYQGQHVNYGQQGQYQGQQGPYGQQGQRGQGYQGQHGQHGYQRQQGQHNQYGQGGNYGQNNQQERQYVPRQRNQDQNNRHYQERQQNNHQKKGNQYYPQQNNGNDHLENANIKVHYDRSQQIYQKKGGNYNQIVFNQQQDLAPPKPQQAGYNQYFLNKINASKQILAVQIKPEPKLQLKVSPKPQKFSIQQIKQIINSATKEDLQKAASPEVIKKANEIAQWQMKEVTVEPKEQKKQKNNQRNDKRNDTNKSNPNNQSIKTGVRKDEATIAQNLGYKPVDKAVVIRFGVNQTLQARKIKEDIKNMHGKDFATLKQKEYQNMNEVEKDRKQIIYNLNLIVPENLKDIQVDLLRYLFNSKEVCKILIEEIIKKAWDQPKYASTYATLCYDFAKKSLTDFKFQAEAPKKQKREGKKDAKRDNPFKYFLIESVQMSFDEKQQKFPEFQNKEDKQLFLKQKKKNILSNVKFIAQLILNRILKKRIIKVCLSRLFQMFFTHYYAYSVSNNIEDSIYDYFYQAVIQFIQNIGSKYDQINLATQIKNQEKGQEKLEEKNENKQQFGQLINNIILLLTKQTKLDQVSLTQLENLNGEQYFKLLDQINNVFMRKANPRLSALLQNLVERKDHKWQKHNAMAEGPKKIKEIQNEIANQEQAMQGKKQKNAEREREKQKQEQEKLDKKVKQLFQGWQINKKQQLRQINFIVKNYSIRAFYLSILKQIADEKKDVINKRLELMPIIIQEAFNNNDFIKAWFDAIRYLAVGSSDYPFCGATLAKIIQIVVSGGTALSSLYMKFQGEDAEDQQYFIEEILQKYYYYTQDEKALKYVKPKSKPSGLL